MFKLPVPDGHGIILRPVPRNYVNRDAFRTPEFDDRRIVVLCVDDVGMVAENVEDVPLHLDVMAATSVGASELNRQQIPFLISHHRVDVRCSSVRAVRTRTARLSACVAIADSSTSGRAGQLTASS